jgi:hypothetical protein
MLTPKRPSRAPTAFGVLLAAYVAAYLAVA